MTLSIGIGCRRSCPAQIIVDLVFQACEGLDTRQARLFTIEAKRDERGVGEASETLGFPLVFLPAEVLRSALPGVSVRSLVVERAMGVPSVAEAAALGGAGVGARLIVPRRSAGGATCAVAVGSGATVR